MKGASLHPAVPACDIDTLTQAFAKPLGLDPKALPAPQRQFLQQVHDDCAADELSDFSPADLGAAMADLWRFGEGANGEPLIRLRHWTGKRDLLEIVQDDKPFLVDSVMGEVAEGGYSVRAMVHPVVELEGGRRLSLIQVHLDAVGEDRAEALIAAIRLVLADVRVAVDDFKAMRAWMRRAIDELAAARIPASDEEREEALGFLRWLEGERFVFLGARVYEYPRTADGGYAPEEPLIRPEGSLGVLRDDARSVLRRANEPAVLSPHLRRYLETDAPLIVAKSNLRSRVHRRGYMDYVGIKRYGPDGRPSGEVRFVGLFTAEAYEEPVREVPLIRRKAARVLDRANTVPGGHNEKRLRNIVETYPRDELFQTGEDELLAIASGILHLYDRPRVRLFMRRDPFDRFVSVLFFVPRERYDSAVRRRAGAILAEAFGGHVSAYYPNFSDAPLARVHFIIAVQPGHHREPDLGTLEAQLTETARTWEDRFEAAVREGGVPAGHVAEALARYAHAFSPGYRDRYDAAEALTDIAVVGAMTTEAVRVRAYRLPTDEAIYFRFKLYRPGGAAPLADVLPILEHMGLKAIIEEGFPICPTGRDPVWVHEFLIEDPAGADLSLADVAAAFEDAFVAVWTGKTESDGFNRLVLELGVSWREAALIRALARFRQQTGLDPSQAVQEAALSDHPEVARLILRLFAIKFDPATGADLKAREEQARGVMAEIIEALQQVDSLDADRVLRRLALLVGAAKRTNYYQAKPYISFKIASGELEDLPAPKPFREIFVWAPHVEGVHLRFGPVARGGLRWSDRRDDFRTEVLGLVKAQQVKNAVIVPVGSKGGFYPKCLPKGGSPDAVREEAVRAYKTFLFGLLDLTDNIDASGKVVHPDGVICHDADDPYLVVAADKGTATFSDAANGVAEDYGFWLGDAFASGGSAGYDHKAMGITARGAWEAVKRHFREMGKDIQIEPFTVVGVGDMSGDVFGNGMLLSEQTRLIAAFDHRHIFIDPDPDAAVSFAERKRLFALPRSSWDDYDRAKVSKGGEVYARVLKSVTLSPEAAAALDLKPVPMTPADVITAILMAKVELLYLGGIGTYVKARGETNADAGDKANDAVRIDGADLRCKVVGEGANLGFTQAGRIEFARAGGRINTDAIDNSAGVDTSDHEVNIKILTGMEEAAGKLTRPDRDALLAEMTDDVAAHVLAHNYDQTLALSLLEQEAASEIAAHGQFMTELVEKGRLDRKVEGLPGPTAMLDLAQAGKGLTRPELAVLLAYGKLDLFHDTVASPAPDDPYFFEPLKGYFPKPLWRFEDDMARHRLRREIIATVLGNEIVNLCGPTFPSRLRAAAGCDTAALVIAFEAARRVLRIDEEWDSVAALDNKVPAPAQLALFQALSAAQRAQTFWLARRAKVDGVTVQGLIDEFRPAVDELKTLIPGVLSPYEQETVAKRTAAFVKAGAPEDLAQQIAALQWLTTAADLVDLAGASRQPLANVTRLYHQVGAAFAFDRMRAAAGAFRGGDSFERLATRRLIEDMLCEQTSLTGAVLKTANGADPKAAVADWSAQHAEPVQGVKSAVEDIEKAGGDWTFAKLTIVNAALRELVNAA